MAKIDALNAYRITFVSKLFRGPKDADASHRVLQILLDALCACNVSYLQDHPETPLLYSSDLITKKPRVHYELEEAGNENWQDIPTTLELGYGDCEDLACWRAAELIVREKILARPTFTFKLRKNGGVLYHIIVKKPDGSIEDPSRRLGM